MPENSTQTEERPLEIALVGAGVCGLTCAIALAKFGASVQVFEAASKFEEIGAGIGIGPNAVRVLDKIGILKNVLAHATEKTANQRAFIMRSGMEGHELICEVPYRSQDLSLGMHRASFLDALVEVIDHNSVHFHKRCISVKPSPDEVGRSVLYFADGTTHEADIVLGADGIKSAVRSAVTGDDHSRVVFGNTVAYRGLVPYEKLKAAGLKMDIGERPVCLIGPNKHFIIFSIRNQTLVNVVIFAADHDAPLGSANLPPGSPWVVPSSTEEILKEFEGWGPDAITVIKCIESPSKWYIHVLYPELESFVKGRVALLGDAAHAMFPHLGAGAGQGIEDAYVLARLLSHPQTTVSNVEAVLQAYGESRRERALSVWHGSVKAGELYDGCGPPKLDFDGLGEALPPIFFPVWDYDLDKKVEETIDHLQKLGVYH